MVFPTFTELDKSLHLVRLAACAVVAAIGPMVPAEKRTSVLAGLGVACVVALDPATFPAWALAAAITFVVVRALARIADASARWRATLVVIALVCVGFFVARGAGLDGTRVAVGDMRLFVFGVDMWMLLRIVAVLWEVGSQKIEPPGVVTYVSWIALPFTFIGPLTRPAQFAASLARPKTPVDLGPVWRRNVLLGCLCLVGAWMTTFVLVTPAVAPAWMKLLAGLSTSPWSFYFGTAGTYALMQAFGVFWGIEIGDSFNFPFGRRNLADFWANWNMTATNLMRDYLFFARWGAKRPNFYLNSFLVFFVVGAWHGSNAYWLIFGAYHGIGYAAFMWLRLHKVRPWPGRVGALAASALTYVFVCVGWLAPPMILKIASHLAAR